MNNSIDGISVIIPSLDPTHRLLGVVTGLIAEGFSDIIVVDDGSDSSYASQFNEIEELPECVVLRHSRNMGKGKALKTAFDFCIKNRPELKGVITADSDGQHLCGDIAKCARALLQSGEAVVMGVRDFKQQGVPKSNATGNRVTVLAFRLLFGIVLQDTQTGLRGIPAQHLPMMLKVSGNRFEYETNMLLEIERHHIPFLEVQIATVYEEGSNERSHYRPVFDSVMIFTRITARVLKYTLSSTASFVVDISLFWLAMRYLGPSLIPWSIPVCTVLARVISAFTHFSINRWLVFRRTKSYGSQLKRYSMLAVIQLTVSTGILWLLAQLLAESNAATAVSVLKGFVDAALFFISYYVQRRWVFAHKKRKE